MKRYIPSGENMATPGKAGLLVAWPCHPAGTGTGRYICLETALGSGSFERYDLVGVEGSEVMGGAVGPGD